jgi:hypothetical protein
MVKSPKNALRRYSNLSYDGAKKNPHAISCGGFSKPSFGGVAFSFVVVKTETQHQLNLAT